LTIAKSDNMDPTRRHVRHVVTPRLYVAMNGFTAGGILYDVSLGGMSLDIVGPKPAGERVLLDFDMSETGEHFEGAGRIIWKSESGNRVGIQFINLPEASHLKIKSWLSAKSITGSVSQNVIVQDRTDATLMESPAWLRDRPASQKAAAVPSEAPINKVRTVPEPPPRVAAADPPPAPVIAEPPLRAAIPVESQEQSTRELRTAFSSRLPAKLQFEPLAAARRMAPDWRQVRQWLLMAAVVVVVVLLLTTVLKISSSGIPIGRVYEEMKAMAFKGAARLEPQPPPPEAPVKTELTSPQPNKEAKVPAGKRLPESPVVDERSNTSERPSDKFEVMDTQHGRRYLPRTSTNLIVQFEKAGKPELGTEFSQPERADGSTSSRPGASSELRGSVPDRILPDIAHSRFGRVLPESSGEIPVAEAIPEYPPFALKKNVQGRVVLTALITKNGSLKDVRVLSSPSALDATVLEAVRTWRYQPHLENGKAVEVVTDIVVDFSITAK
jgi:TonB family protein